MHFNKIIIALALWAFSQFCQAEALPLEAEVTSATTSAAKLTVTPGGTARLIQVFYYNDTGCTGLLGSASVLDNGTGFAFSSGQTFSLNSSTAYQLAVNAGVTPSSVACMKMYVDGGAQSSSGASCQSFTDETCSSGSSTCTSNQTKSVSWAASPTVCATRYAYISQNNATATQNIYKCTVEADGVLDNCALTGPSTLTNLNLGNAIYNGYGYFSNVTSSTSQVSICPVNAATGAVSGTCSAATGASLTTPKSLALSAGYAYVLDTAATLTPCTLGSSGALSCTTRTGSGFSDPYGIAINNNFVYIASNAGGSGSGNVIRCTVSGTTLSSCVGGATASAVVKNPRGVTFYNNYAYFVNNTTNGSGGAIAYCGPALSNGTFTACADSGAPAASFTSPQGIAIYNGYVYVTNSSGNTVTKCTLTSATAIGSCGSTATAGTAFNSPTGISIF